MRRKLLTKTILFCTISVNSFALGNRKPTEPEQPPADPLPQESIFKNQIDLTPGIEAISNPWSIDASLNATQLSILEGENVSLLINGKKQNTRSTKVFNGDLIQLKALVPLEKNSNKIVKIAIGPEIHYFSLRSSQQSALSKYYRAMYRGDPAKEVFIGYGSEASPGNSSRIYYDTRDCGTDISCYRNNQDSVYEVDYRGMDNVFVHLDNLEAKTKYYFVIVENNQVSRRFSIETMSNSTSDPISFVAGGDSRNNQQVRRETNLMVAKLNPNFVLFGGDMTGSDKDSEWREWFEDWQLTIREDGRLIPIITARGNHEDSNSTIEKLFMTPTNVYYSVSMNGGLFKAIVLNTEASITGNQSDWLENDLQQSEEIWKTAIYHKPMRPHTWTKPEGSRQYSSWAHLFYENAVQIVVESDSHTVKRTYPIRPETGRGSDEGFIEANDGTVYLGEGCWGAPLRSNNDNKNWTRASGSFNQFNWIWMDQHKVEIRTVKTYNSSQINPLSDADRFSEPSNIDIWSPSTGRVISLESKQYVQKLKGNSQKLAQK